MDSIKLKFKASTKAGKEGQLFFQVIHKRAIRRINTGCRILAGEWSDNTGSILLPDRTDLRYPKLKSIARHCKLETERFDMVAHSFAGKVYSVDELLDAFIGTTADETTLFQFMRKKIAKLKQVGRIRCSETMDSTMRSFMQFRGGMDIGIDKLTKDMIMQYEAWLLARGVKRNTSSYYMRNLRSAYNDAIEEGLTVDRRIFSKVYTGIDKTVKRAISIDDIRKIKKLELDGRPALLFAHDMLMMCFYLRGISFVDLAYLKKQDMQGNRLLYCRNKTRQQLAIEFPPEAAVIVSKYKSDTQYLLPIITAEDGTERKQYQRRLTAVNRNLKKVSKLAGLSITLSTYVMRHSWATIARDKGIEISVISKALGHDSEKTTMIYLDSISTVKVDKANRKILDDLM